MMKFKVLLLVALVIVLGAGGYLLYMFKFKEYDVADEEVKEIVEEAYKVELPDGSTIVIDENGEVAIEESATSVMLAGKTAGPESNSTSTSNNTTATTTSSEQPTVATIKDKYKPALEGLEGQADAKLNALAGRAKSEYQDKQANGEKIDYGYFYNKYMSAANNLEGLTDTTFDAVLNAIEKDLAVNGYDESYAQSFKEEYEATKKARRDNLLNKALGR